MIGTDGFQETPIVEVTRQITKHNYLVLDLNDLPRIMKEVRALQTAPSTRLEGSTLTISQHDQGEVDTAPSVGTFRHAPC